MSSSQCPTTGLVEAFETDEGASHGSEVMVGLGVANDLGVGWVSS